MTVHRLAFSLHCLSVGYLCNIHLFLITVKIATLCLQPIAWIWLSDLFTWLSTYTYNSKQLAALHFRRYRLTFCVSCSCTCNRSFCVITVSTVQLQTVQFVQYLYGKFAVLLCSWTCSSSLCVITVSTVQLQPVQFVQYLYSKCAVLLSSWTRSSSLCVITVSTVQLQTVQFVQYLYSKCAVLLCSTVQYLEPYHTQHSTLSLNTTNLTAAHNIYHRNTQQAVPNTII